MNQWSEFAAALLAFFILHSLPIRPAVKTRIVSLIGARLFTLVYSCVSIAALGWLIVAASRAPYVELWAPAPWQHLAALIIMLGVSLIVAFTLGRPNPFSFGGSSTAAFDPAHAGIVRLHRHPLLLAFFLWAGAHLLPNGDLAHAILFGLFAGFSLIGMKLIDRRTRRRLDPQQYEALLKSVQKSGLLQGFAQDQVRIRIAAGVGLFVGLVLLHPVVIGDSPLAALS
ncbi:NnrU family protein [Hoeflea sp. YIM 152468]|uniref:NnrU family protein n=1 Tax=Hoeflea sp. YIM 152468 TaxID=3031759 RepID=UPI0023DBA5F8|nr:NnrU family protein [Hoeflea sp. YIM 152468]MDF1606894.1 NnrU family protein [Hoeflea sp. YIM 152468]